MDQKELTFSENARAELSVLTEAVKEIVSLAQRALEHGDLSSAEQVEPLEQVIDELRDEVKRRHVLRLQNNQCTMEQGFILTDILTDLERVADHCSNVAGCMLELSRDRALGMHRYRRDYRRNSGSFQARKRRYAEKYRLPSDS